MIYILIHKLESFSNDKNFLLLKKEKKQLFEFSSRYIPNKTQPPTTTTNYYQQTPTSTVKDTYQCRECGSVTNYHHR